MEQPHYESEFTTKSHLYKEFADRLLDFTEVSATALSISGSKSRLLDVGAGRGWLVERARLRGFDAVGVELNQANVFEARRDGIPLFESMSDLNLERSQQAFDIVVFSAVIEHVPDPISFIKDSVQNLRTGGLVVIAQAAFDGLLPTLAPWLWYGWQPQEHYWHFDEAALRKLLQLIGIESIWISRNSLHHPFIWAASPKNLIGRNAATALGRIGELVSHGDQLYAAGVWR